MGLFGGMGGGGGGGGLLAGLGGKFKDLMMGTSPEMQTTAAKVLPPAGVLGPDGAAPEAISQMPQIQATGKTTGGLLSKFNDQDARGLSFADKLFAAGSVMQGDSGGAATYLQNQRGMADQLAERTRSRDMAKRGHEALRSNIDPMTGEVNFRGYLDALGPEDDIGGAIDMASKLSPKVGLQNAGGGGLYETRQGPFGGNASVRELVAPQPRKLPNGLRLGDDGQPEVDQDWIDLQEATAAARRRGAPPVGGRGGGRGGRRNPYSGMSTDQIKAALGG